jgi:hypothetical protein
MGRGRSVGRDAMAAPEPNLYSLIGLGVQLTYSTTSFAGKPQLTYQDTQHTQQFAGEDIRHADDADLGTLVAVSIAKTVDAGYTSLTLVVPRVALPRGQPVHVRTVAIRSLHLLTVDTPKMGQLDSYEVLDLHGTASQVEF